MRFDLNPHVGTNGILFGMSREVVRKLLGTPFSSGEKSTFSSHGFTIPLPAKDGYWENSLQVLYDDNNCVNFIEFHGRGAQVKVFLEGIDIFQTPAPQLIADIQKKRGISFDESDPEIPYSYTFPDIDLAFWRQVIPELDEEKQPIPDSDEGKYFWTVAIGAKGYCRNK
jgi:hypothetical protein